MTLRPTKHEKVDQIGQNSNVFRLARAQSAEEAVGTIESNTFVRSCKLTKGRCDYRNSPLY